MTKELQKAFSIQLKNSSWFKGEPLKVALRKLAKMEYSIGFPWGIKDVRDLDRFYSGFPNSEKRFFVPWLRASSMVRWQAIHNQSDTNFPVDNVNAYYSSYRNKIDIPAALIHPRVYFPGGPSSYNYGSLGKVSEVIWLGQPSAIEHNGGQDFCNIPCGGA